MKIAFATSEVAPFIKTGGLADVAASLPDALASAGHEIIVFCPLYGKIKSGEYFKKFKFIKDFYTPLSWRNQYTGLFVYRESFDKPTICFIDNEYYFNRTTSSYIYGDYDDGEKFAFFSRAIIEAFSRLNFIPDVVHCNDWHTALVPVFLREFYPEYNNVKTLFTIHNIEYQGFMPMEFAGDVAGLSPEATRDCELNGCINLMKGAIVRSDRVSTVSETYADEILYMFYSNGLCDILSQNRFKLCGIVNGIDTKLYDPAIDKHIYSNYNAEDMSAKIVNKTSLQKDLGLNVDDNIPLIGMVTRLAAHKGIDLVEQVLDGIVKLGAQVVVLGTGEPRFEEMFRQAQYRHPGMIAASITFSSDLASKIYAASDIFLMPSKSEPCGLSQMVAMRYGAVPVVRETGGLIDTVPAYNIRKKTGRGFTFYDYTAHELFEAVKRCISLYYNHREYFTDLQKNDMNCDFSWNNSMNKYLDLYGSLISGK